MLHFERQRNSSMKAGGGLEWDWHKIDLSKDDGGNKWQTRMKRKKNNRAGDVNNHVKKEKETS